MYFAYEVGAPQLDRGIARWAIRLKSLFYDGSPNGVNALYSWAFLYAQRERASQVLGQNYPYTGDIDAQIVFRVWEKIESSDNIALYERAIAEGTYPESRHPFEDLQVLHPGGDYRVLVPRE